MTMIVDGITLPNGIKVGSWERNADLAMQEIIGKMLQDSVTTAEANEYQQILAERTERLTKGLPKIRHN